jgi:hypothetical protein
VNAIEWTAVALSAAVVFTATLVVLSILGSIPGGRKDPTMADGRHVNEQEAGTMVAEQDAIRDAYRAAYTLNERNSS